MKISLDEQETDTAIKDFVIGNPDLIERALQDYVSKQLTLKPDQRVAISTKSVPGGGYTAVLNVLKTVGESEAAKQIGTVPRTAARAAEAGALPVAGSKPAPSTPVMPPAAVAPVAPLVQAAQEAQALNEPVEVISVPTEVTPSLTASPIPAEAPTEAVEPEVSSIPPVTAASLFGTSPLASGPAASLFGTTGSNSPTGNGVDSDGSSGKPVGLVSQEAEAPAPVAPAAPAAPAGGLFSFPAPKKG